MKRVCCLLLAALLLLAIFGCKSDKQKDGNTQADNGPKKDQVVHVGETVQYGDLEFTFVEQMRTSDVAGIHVVCKYNGNGEVHLTRNSFKAYVDGEPKNGLTSSFFESYYYNRNDSPEDWYKYEFSLTNGRSSGLWVVTRTRDGEMSRMDDDGSGYAGSGYPDEWDDENLKNVEFDFTKSEYSDEWGKVTFVVDLP